MQEGNGSALATLEKPQGGTLANRQSRADVMRVGERGIKPENVGDLWLISQRIAESGLAPKGMEKPETIFVALEMGMELGLPMMAALRNIAVINGRAAVWGDAALALVQNSGLVEDYDEYVEGEGDQMAGVVTSKRRGRSRPQTTRFSVADAKRAGLWGKQGPWSQYAPRMLKLRARGFNLRDQFPEVLQGLYTAEEAMDIPVDPVIQVSAVPNPSNALNARLRQVSPVNEQTGEVLDASSSSSATPPTPEPAAAPSSEAAATNPEAEPVAQGGGVPENADAEWFAIKVCEQLGCSEQDAYKKMKVRLPKEWDKLKQGQREDALKRLRAGEWG